MTKKKCKLCKEMFEDKWTWQEICSKCCLKENIFKGITVPHYKELEKMSKDDLILGIKKLSWELKKIKEGKF